MGTWTAFSLACYYEWCCVACALMYCVVTVCVLSLGRALHSALAGAVRWFLMWSHLPTPVTVWVPPERFCSHCLTLRSFVFSHSGGCTVVLICFSLMTDHSHHFFIFIGLKVTSFMNFQLWQSFIASLFIWEYLSFTYWFVYSFYTSECNLLLTLYSAAILLYSGLPFWFQNDVFVKDKFSISVNQIHFGSFSFMASVFVVFKLSYIYFYLNIFVSSLRHLASQNYKNIVLGFCKRLILSSTFTCLHSIWN